MSPNDRTNSESTSSSSSCCQSVTVDRCFHHRRKVVRFCICLLLLIHVAIGFMYAISTMKNIDSIDLKFPGNYFHINNLDNNINSIEEQVLNTQKEGIITSKIISSESSPPELVWERMQRLLPVCHSKYRSKVIRTRNCSD